MNRPILPEDELESALDWLQRRFQPAAILLYGSRARGQARPESDVDLALLFGRRPRPTAWELAAARTELEDRLGQDVDLVVLDTASPILAMEVLRHGRLLRQSDPMAVPDFTMYATTAWADLKRARRPVEEALARP